MTIAEASRGGLRWRLVAPYVGAQLVGGCAGVFIAHVMFGEPLFMWSQHPRGGAAQIFSEAVATFGLVAVISGCSRSRSAVVAFAVGAYITSAYWFTASTSFANPAVTVARTLTDTFSGIRPSDAPGFVAGQLIGAASAMILFRWLLPPLPATTDDDVAPACEPRAR